MSEAERPHILFILTDQQRADCLGCAGHRLLKTPNLDRLATESVRFSHAFTTSPLCAPARLSLITGLYPHNSNLWSNDEDLPVTADTYVKRLRAEGYRTATIGKNHLHEIENIDFFAYEEFMHRIGFDDVYETPGTWGNIGGDNVYIRHLRRHGLHEVLSRYLAELEAKPDQVRRFIAEPLPIPAELYLDTFLGDVAVQYLREYDYAEPSFLFVGFQGPHEPWDVPEKYYRLYDCDQIPDPIPEMPNGDWLPERSRRYQRWAQYYQPERPRALKEISASYFGKISLIDDSVGKIVDAYRRKGWWEKTVVVFASDHGEMLGDLGRLSKSVCYDSAIRVPLMMRTPGRQAAGVVSDSFVETIDLYATLLELTGCEPAERKDSLSLVPLLNAPAASLRRDVLAEVHVHTMLRTREWKLVVGRDGLSLQLFDLRADPHEQCNLVGHPEYRQQELEMRSQLLTRILINTLREGEYDPEFSGHSWPDPAS